MSVATADTLWTIGVFGTLVLGGVLMWYFGVYKNRK